jgi:hypothetical protein
MKAPKAVDSRILQVVIGMSAVRSLAPRFSFLGERMFHSFSRLYLGTRFGLTIWRANRDPRQQQESVCDKRLSTLSTNL